MRTEHQFKLLSQSINTIKDYAIFLLDPTGKILSWNRGAELLKGYKPEEVIGKSFTIFYEPEEVAKNHPLELLRLAQVHGSYEEEGWRVRKDGTKFWADVVISAVYNDQHQLEGFTKVTRDLTKRMLAEEALKREKNQLQQLIQSDTVIWKRSLNGAFENPQPSWEAFTGQCWDEYKDFGWLLAHPPERREEMKRIWQEKALMPDLWEYDAQLWSKKGGDYVYVLLRVIPELNDEKQVISWSGITIEINQLKKTENELKQVVDKLSLTLGTAQVGLWEWDFVHNKIKIDAHIARHFGIALSTFKGSFDELFKYVSNDDKLKFQAELGELSASNANEITNELKVMHQSGKIVYLRGKGIIRRDSTGKAISMLKAEWDCTQEKQLIVQRNKAEEAERSLRSTTENLKLALDAAQAGTWHWDIEKNIIHWDDAMYKIYGLQLGAFLGGIEEVLKLIHPEDQERVSQAIQRSLSDTGFYNVEYRIIWLDGSTHIISAQGKIFSTEEGKPISLRGVAIDISYRKQLEHETKEAIRKQQEANDKAELAEKNRDMQAKFIDTLCHEIRNPLHGILSNLQHQKEALSAIKSSFDQQSPFYRTNQELIDKLIKQIKHLEKSMYFMEECGEHQLNIVNHMLDISKIEAGKMSLENKVFSIVEILKAALGMCKMQAKQKGLHIKLDLPETDYLVKSDPTRVKQIIVNLMSNAIKYTPSGGHIFVLLKVKVKNENAGVEITIQDSGPGFTEQEQKELFNRFSQMTRNKELKYNSTGLGLVISRELASLLNGDLHLESQKLRGSTFRVAFNWPLVNALLKERKKSSLGFFSSLEDKKNLRVLIAEDNEINQKVFKRMLKSLGYSYEIASDGIEVVEKFQSFSPDIIFMDIEMPHQNGLEAAKAIRDIEKKFSLKPIAIYAVTGYAREEYKAEADAAGMNGFITKPFKKEEINQIISQLTPSERRYSTASSSAESPSISL